MGGKVSQSFGCFGRDMISGKYGQEKKRMSNGSTLAVAATRMVISIGYQCDHCAIFPYELIVHTYTL